MTASAVVRSIPTPDPLDVLRDAATWAALAGYAVYPGQYGVMCARVLSEPRWIRRPGERFIDPVGAVVLMRQPHASELPDAGAEAIGVSVACIEGMVDGLDHRPQRSVFMQGANAAMYLSGFETGTRFRMELLTEVCPRDNTRHKHNEECPACEVREGLASDLETA